MPVGSRIGQYSTLSAQKAPQVVKVKKITQLLDRTLVDIDAPLREAWNQPVESRPIKMGWGKFPSQVAQFVKRFGPPVRQMHGAARPQQRRFASRPVGVEHRPGRQGQPPLRRVAAKARLPEGGRSPGRVAAAQVLGLDDQDAGAVDQPGAEAGAGDSASDDDDVICLHRGGWLRF